MARCCSPTHYARSAELGFWWLSRGRRGGWPMQRSMNSPTPSVPGSGGTWPPRLGTSERTPPRTRPAGGRAGIQRPGSSHQRLQAHRRYQPGRLPADPGRPYRGRCLISRAFSRVDPGRRAFRRPFSRYRLRLEGCCGWTETGSRGRTCSSPPRDDPRSHRGRPLARFPRSHPRRS